MGIYPLPVSASRQEYQRQAEELLETYVSGNEAAIRFCRDYHPHWRELPAAEHAPSPFTMEDARLALTGWYHFQSWQDLMTWAQQMEQEHSPVSQFESAVEGIITGDTTRLRSLLLANPGLISARSTRKHHATLLHYTGTNGVEDYRQKYPANAVEVLQLLLAAGADVNATAEMYGGGSTTLALVATSIHPVHAGVLFPLLETLLAAGAVIDLPEAAAKGKYTVNSCLHNGRPEAADFLARHGARLDLEGAAGIGRLDVTRSFFQEDGSLKATATRAQQEAGFVQACTYGHMPVIEWLIDKEPDLDQVQVDGMNALHWAIIGGQPDVVKLLLERNVSLETRNVYGGTALEAALWALVNSWPKTNTYDVGIITMLVNAGAQIEPGTLPWLAAQKDLAVSKRSALEKILQRH